MAAIDTRTAPASAPVANRFGSAATSLLGSIVAWHEARLTRKALLDLTDRELDDIGLSRGDIDRVARAGR